MTETFIIMISVFWFCSMLYIWGLYRVHKKENKNHPLGVILASDSYKMSHHAQYPPNTTNVYSYFESRGGKYDEIVFVGLTYILKKWLVGVVVNQAMIDEAAKICEKHFGPGSNVFNREGWEYILREHGGELPIRIKALPEGTVVPTKNCLMTVENTDPNCYWLVNFVETLLVQVWYPITVATNSREQKKIIFRFLKETGDPSGIDFKLHDFGCRGVSSMETASIGGWAHLTQFLGTDTMPALILAKNYYDCDCAGFSIPASEHSTMTAWTKEKQLESIENMLIQYETGLVACVCDSWDIYDVCENILPNLKERIMKRDGTLVVRPDSGDPPTVCLRILEILGDKFGKDKNDKGYWVLPPQLRIIQGDGVDIEMIEKVLQHLKDHKWSADNIAFGSGGGLLQKMDRDTQKCAFKASSMKIDEQEINVSKDPITDPGKKSKKGRMTVNKRDRNIITLCGDDQDKETDMLNTIFENGKLLVNPTMNEIRKRSLI